MELQIGKYNILLHTQPLEILNRFKQHEEKAPEAGGILLGKIINEQINILKLSIPTVLDTASRMNFERSKIGAQIIVDYEFYNSNGQLTYLGEWHTHPEPFPSPSHTDLRMLKNQFKSNQLNTNFLILLIKGTTGMYMRVIDKEGYLESEITLTAS